VQGNLCVISSDYAINCVWCSHMRCDLHLQDQTISHTRNQHEGGSKLNLVHTSFLVYSLALKMEVSWSSETSYDFQQTTGQNIPEDRILHNYHWEFWILKYVWCWFCLLPSFCFVHSTGIITFWILFKRSGSFKNFRSSFGGVTCLICPFTVACMWAWDS
jgi:hypothetical protein